MTVLDQIARGGAPDSSTLPTRHGLFETRTNIGDVELSVATAVIMMINTDNVDAT